MYKLVITCIFMRMHVEWCRQKQLAREGLKHYKNVNVYNKKNKSSNNVEKCIKILIKIR